MRKEGMMNKVETVNHGILREIRGGIFVSDENEIVYFTIAALLSEVDEGLFDEEIEIINDGGAECYVVVKKLTFREFKKLAGMI
jgi:hypothetical protein